VGKKTKLSQGGGNGVIKAGLEGGWQVRWALKDGGIGGPRPKGRGTPGQKGHGSNPKGSDVWQNQ